ncbi:gdhA [Acrasis kona]|uniref:GdhA n=1 Tax=Acrasis kona TaxID=1008807 RepID=A0AAW2YGX2_9EUKA
MSRIPKSYVGYALPTGKDARVHVELFADVLCPFSKKAYLKLKEVTEHYSQKGTPIQFKVVNAVQPWHPQSYYLTLTTAAVNLLSKKKTQSDEVAFKLLDKLFQSQEEYSDENVADKTPNQITKQLVDVASEVSGLTQDEIQQQIKQDSTVVYVKGQIKYARQNAVHVTPTVAVNGLIENSVSSSWTLEQWTEFLDPILQN